MVSIAVMVSGSGTNLQAILDAQKKGVIQSGKVALVISDRKGAYAIERAKKQGIEAWEIDRKDYSSRDEFFEKIAARLEERGIGLIVLAGFMSILSGAFVRRYSMKIINIHPSLIPAFCGKGYYGLKVHQAALDYGVKITGATVHFVTEEVDGGPVILQKAVDIPQGIRAEELQQLVLRECEWDILPRAVELFCAGKLEIKGRIVTMKMSPL